MKNSLPKYTSHFIESIQLKDGTMPLLPLHQKRVEHTLRYHFPVKTPVLKLSEVLSSLELPQKGCYKLRLVYGRAIQEVSISPYQLSLHRKVLLHESMLEYSFKYQDRSLLEAPLACTDYDDVIYLRNGFLTDAWYSNICLRQAGKWYTPENCLLPGVKRRQLLNDGSIKIRAIHKEQLSSYDAIAFINALRDFEKIYSFEMLNGSLILKQL